MDEKDAGVTRADEEGCGVDGSQGGDLERCWINVGEGKAKRRQGGAVIEKNAAMAGPKEYIPSC
jgi:hypothetical protein